MVDFDRIAESWYSRRHYTIFPDELSELSGKWKGRLLNIGCGHGADFLPFKGMGFAGLDNSMEMLNNAKKYAGKFGISPFLVLGDASSLPFKTGCFDNAIAIAAFHHLREGREAAFTELFRVLKEGGQAFVTVWNKTQPRFLLSGKEVSVPWATSGGKAERYYYLFDYGEITRLAKKSGFEVLKAFPERKHKIPIRELSRNICLLLRKP